MAHLTQQRRWILGISLSLLLLALVIIMRVDINLFHERPHVLLHVCHELFGIDSSHFPLLILRNAFEFGWIIVLVIVFRTVSDIVPWDSASVANVPFLRHFVCLLIVQSLGSCTESDVVAACSSLVEHEIASDVGLATHYNIC